MLCRPHNPISGCVGTQTLELRSCGGVAPKLRTTMFLSQTSESFSQSSIGQLARLKVPLLRTGEFIQNLVVSKITTLQQLRLAG